MITKQRAERLRKKILESRCSLMEEQPFFAILLMYLKFVAVCGMKKISTDGIGIYFDPDYVDKLHPGELDFVLCHQIMHLICGDVFAPPDIFCDSFHLACDIRVNCLLAEMGIDAKHFPHLGNIQRRIPGFGEDHYPEKMTSMEIFNKLPLNIDAFDENIKNRYLFDSDEFWNNRKSDIEDSVVLIDIYEKDPLISFGKSSGEELAPEGNGSGILLKQIWKSRANASAKQISEGKRGKGAGNLSEQVERIIKKGEKGTLDWKKLLNNFIQEQTCDYSFSPPDRRFSDTDFFLPDFNEKDFLTKEILFMVDTSGSVDDRELGEVYTEIASAIEQFGGKLRGKLGFFDTEVKEPVPFGTVEELMKIAPFGFGGTDFCAIFDYIASEKGELPSCVVIFTDGDGAYPEEKAAMGIRVLWIINNMHFTPPWGKIARKTVKKNG